LEGQVRDPRRLVGSPLSRRITSWSNLRRSSSGPRKANQAGEGSSATRSSLPRNAEGKNLSSRARERAPLPGRRESRQNPCHSRFESRTAKDRGARDRVRGRSSRGRFWLGALTAALTRRALKSEIRLRVRLDAFIVPLALWGFAKCFAWTRRRGRERPWLAVQRWRPPSSAPAREAASLDPSPAHPVTRNGRARTHAFCAR
jgi:hypothetical protein